jgi:N,N'-diacetyllegionaminate synthase
MVKFKFSKLKKTFLIAEAGINHNGKIEQAFKLIDQAKISGADSIKFQTYKTEKRVPSNSVIFDILKKCELSNEAFYKIKKYCDKKKIIFFSTPFDLESVDFLEKIKVNLYKISSFDISNAKLINYVSSKLKPTLVSTGMASIKEIDRTYKIFKKQKCEIGLLHCISSYPNKETDSYLSNITFLNKKFNCPVGLSDHTNDIKTSIYSCLLGAIIIEKHFMLSNNHNCPDKAVSLTPKQMNKLRSELNLIPLIINKPTFGVRKVEKNIKIFKRRKIL